MKQGLHNKDWILLKVGLGGKNVGGHGTHTTAGSLPTE